MLIVGAPSFFFSFFSCCKPAQLFITRKQESFELISGWLGSLIEDLNR
jgi:hypothetical protein